MIAVIDYGRGNLFSLSRALEHVGARHRVTADPEAVATAEGLVLPGVGAFGDAMAALARSDLIDAITDAARRGTPLLGICLGMQLLFRSSSEFGRHFGLDLIPGTVERLPRGRGGREDLRIPNVGWRKPALWRDDPLTAGVTQGQMFYFVHTYVARPDDPETVVATIPVNGLDAAIMVRRGNVVGCQFHPEKSAAPGLGLLKRYVDVVAAQDTQKLSA